MNLIIRLFIGILLGAAVGLFGEPSFIRVMLTLKDNIAQLINFIVPFIILFFIASGIASLKDQPGKTLGITTAIAYASSILAGLLAMFVALNMGSLFSSHSMTTFGASEKLTSYFVLPINPIFDIFTALLLAFSLGVGMTATSSTQLKQIIDQCRDITEYMVSKVLLSLLPLFIAGIFTEMVADGVAAKTLSSFSFVLITAFVLHWIWLCILYTFSGLISKKNPLKALKTMLPAYATALSTMSSAATIPVALEQTKKNIQNPSVANFTVPLCANIHLCGSMITITTCAIAVTQISPQITNASIEAMIPFIMVLGMVMIAAPGVPGGAVMSALGVLSSMLGFDSAAIGLMIALYIAQDSFGTACNVTGDGAIALLIDKHTQSIAIKGC